MQVRRRFLAAGVGTVLVVAFAFGPAAFGVGADELAACSAAVDDGEYREAIKLCNRALESGALSDEDIAEALYKRGDAYYYRGEYDRAIEDFTRALRLQPDYAAIYIARGDARIRLVIDSWTTLP